MRTWRSLRVGCCSAAQRFGHCRWEQRTAAFSDQPPWICNDQSGYARARYLFWMLKGFILPYILYMTPGRFFRSAPVRHLPRATGVVIQSGMVTGSVFRAAPVQETNQCTNYEQRDSRGPAVTCQWHTGAAGVRASPISDIRHGYVVYTPSSTLARDGLGTAL